MSLVSPDRLPDRLARYLSEQTGGAVQVTDLHPLAGGASRDSWAFSASFAEGDAQRFVLRRDLPTTMNDQALTRAQEFTLMRHARAHGVLAAEVVWLCDSVEPLGLPFFIMRHVEGISIGRKVVSLPELAAARTALPAQMAEQLALIHRLPTAPVGFLAHPSAQGAAHDAIAQAYNFLDSMGAVVPALEYALRWCVRHAPAAGRTTVIHGDFRVGNLLVNPDGLAAVIDWEFAHLGDPHEELGYLCMRDWRFGVDGLRAGGLAHREDFLRSYEHFSGQTVERSAVTWWEIVGNVRWAVICLTQAQRHLSGQDRNVELASLGRRSVEIQAEALRLIQQTEQGAL